MIRIYSIPENTFSEDDGDDDDDAEANDEE
jgi:hypothetical protein